MLVRGWCGHVQCFFAFNVVYIRGDNTNTTVAVASSKDPIDLPNHIGMMGSNNLPENDGMSNTFRSHKCKPKSVTSAKPAMYTYRIQCLNML